jgi:hypothetical protein
MKCEHCRNSVLQKTGNGIRLRIKGDLVFEDGQCLTKCYWCGKEITIPVKITEVPVSKKEKFIIKN